MVGFDRGLRTVVAGPTTELSGFSKQVTDKALAALQLCPGLRTFGVSSRAHGAAHFSQALWARGARRSQAQAAVPFRVVLGRRWARETRAPRGDLSTRAFVRAGDQPLQFERAFVLAALAARFGLPVRDLQPGTPRGSVTHWPVTVPGQGGVWYQDERTGAWREPT